MAATSASNVSKSSGKQQQFRVLPQHDAPLAPGVAGAARPTAVTRMSKENERDAGKWTDRREVQYFFFQTSICCCIAKNLQQSAAAPAFRAPASRQFGGAKPFEVYPEQQARIASGSCADLKPPAAVLQPIEAPVEKHPLQVLHPPSDNKPGKFLFKLIQ